MEYISAKTAGTLDGLFRERVRLSPQLTAYQQFDRASGEWQETSWSQMAELVSRWQQSLRKENLHEGDRIALVMSNRKEWVAFEQAGLGLGLVVVPLYVDDRPDNMAYILNDSGAKLLLLENDKQFNKLLPLMDELESVQRFVILGAKSDKLENDADGRAVLARDWLADTPDMLHERGGDPHKLASIVYTSGTTGRSKGVMLSHHNMMSIAEAAIIDVRVQGEHCMLSFLPLSHTLERTAGYILPMMIGAKVAYARSIQLLADDLQFIKPTALISVPRIYERVYERMQKQLQQKSVMARALFNMTINIGWRRFQCRQKRATWSPDLLLWPMLDRLVASKLMEKLGGRLQFAVSGGAALPPNVGKIFISMGLNLLQGYGLTETSPVLSVNLPDANQPDSVGRALNCIELRVDEHDELLARSPGVMLGYWNNHRATSDMIDADGWLHTGDKARIEDGFVYITGRIKDIIIMSNGEKIPPVDMENAIALHPMFDHALVVGEGKAYLGALVVLNAEEWLKLAKEHQLDPFDKHSLDDKNIKHVLLHQVADSLKDFPGYAKIRRIKAVLEPWTIENDLLTPTLKTRRAKVSEKYANDIEAMYEE